SGGWLVGRPVDLGPDVVCLVRDWVPSSELLARRDRVPPDRVTIVRGDVRRQAPMERILGGHEIDTGIPPGAQTIVGIANRNPVSTFDSNIRGTWALLEASR